MVCRRKEEERWTWLWTDGKSGSPQRFVGDDRTDGEDRQRKWELVGGPPLLSVARLNKWEHVGWPPPLSVSCRKKWSSLEARHCRLSRRWLCRGLVAALHGRPRSGGAPHFSPEVSRTGRLTEKDQPLSNVSKWLLQIWAVNQLDAEE
ncbi:unnamed protein product [Cuscuta campestris]|uniref:Uncharacterized protein n=1 Tax=Cuscuta campestris TaxID=132261 RepID=A0A484N7E4_9ASTE|nr:unnamed protein product [Cuscuta campestris]